MISLSCFACMNGLHRVVKSAINSDSGDFHSGGYFNTSKNAVLDNALLMDSFRNIGIQMKRENAPLSMENVRFFLRDLAPRDVAKRRIKAKVHSVRSIEEH